MNENAVRLAVRAHIRHAETNYDSLLVQGYERREARAAVEAAVDRVSVVWEGQV